MKPFEAGSVVAGGYYWNGARWHLEVVPGEGGLLEGGRGERFVRLAPPVVALVALTLSLLFVVFLPLFGVAMLAYALLRPGLGLAEKLFQSVMATLSPSWRPGEAHFTGSPPEHEEEAGAAPPAPGEPLEALQAEVDQRRREAGAGPGKE